MLFCGVSASGEAFNSIAPLVQCAKRCAYCRERIFVSFRKLFSFLGIWLLLYVKKLFKGAFTEGQDYICSIKVETALIPNFNDMIY